MRATELDNELNDTMLSSPPGMINHFFYIYCIYIFLKNTHESILVYIYNAFVSAYLISEK